MTDLQKNIIGLFLIAGIAYLIWSVKVIILYIFISGILALLGKPIVSKLNKIKFGNKKFPSALSAIITMFFLFLCTLFLFSIFIPILAAEVNAISEIDIEKVIQKLQEPIQKLNTWLGKFNISESSIDINEKLIGLFSFSNLSLLANNLFSLFGNLFIASFSITFITFFFLKEKGLAKSIFYSIFPEEQHQRINKVLQNTKILLRRYFIGLLIQIATITTLVSICLAILDVKNAIAIGFFAGIINIIPYLGPFFGCIAGVSMTILSNIDLPLNEVTPILILVILVFICVQIIDNILLQPYIFSNSVKAHPLEIFLIIISSGTLVGIGGMIIAIPTYTFLRIILKEFLSEHKLVQNITKNI